MFWIIIGRSDWKLPPSFGYPSQKIYCYLTIHDRQVEKSVFSFPLRVCVKDNDLSRKTIIPIIPSVSFPVSPSFISMRSFPFFPLFLLHIWLHNHNLFSSSSQITCSCFINSAHPCKVAHLLTFVFSSFSQDVRLIVDFRRKGLVEKWKEWKEWKERRTNFLPSCESRWVREKRRVLFWEACVLPVFPRVKLRLIVLLSVLLYHHLPSPEKEISKQKRILRHGFFHEF